MLRAIKIRLYPNKEQELKLNKVLGCYRFVYNQMLALKQKEYNENKKSLGLTDLSKYFHGTLLKDEQYSWLKEQNTKVMKQSIRQMLSAYDKFFKQHNGFPKFKSKKDKQSALFPLEAISKHNSGWCRLDGTRWGGSGTSSRCMMKSRWSPSMGRLAPDAPVRSRSMT